MAHDVFISYAAEDKHVADAAVATLEARDIRCWIAPRDVLPGQEWANSITKAIKEARLMILIFSSSANRSQQIRREVNLAIEKEIPIIPFRIEDVIPAESLEYYIEVTHWLDALTPPLEQHLQRLAEVSSRLLGRAATTRGLRQPIPEQPKHGSARRMLFWSAGVLLVAAAIAVVFLISQNSRPAGPGNTTLIKPANNNSTSTGSGQNNSAGVIPVNPDLLKAVIRRKIELPYLANESGWVTKLGHVGTGADHPPQAGDFNNNEPVRGFLSFDLAPLPKNAQIESATLYLTDEEQRINFYEFGSLKFEAVFYGSSLSPSVYNTTSYAVLQNAYGKPSAQLVVIDPLQRALRQEYSRFQVRFAFTLESNNNNQGEIYGFHSHLPRLEVEYRQP